MVDILSHGPAAGCVILPAEAGQRSSKNTLDSLLVVSRCCFCESICPEMSDVGVKVAL